MRELIESAIEYLRQDPGFVAVALWLLQLAGWAAWRFKPTARALFPLTRYLDPARRTSEPGVGTFVRGILYLPGVVVDLALVPVCVLLGIRRRKRRAEEGEVAALADALVALRDRVTWLEHPPVATAAGKYVVWAHDAAERLEALERKTETQAAWRDETKEAERLAALEAWRLQISPVDWRRVEALFGRIAALEKRVVPGGSAVFVPASSERIGPPPTASETLSPTRTVEHATAHQVPPQVGVPPIPEDVVAREMDPCPVRLAKATAAKHVTEP